MKSDMDKGMGCASEAYNNGRINKQSFLCWLKIMSNNFGIEAIKWTVSGSGDKKTDSGFCLNGVGFLQ